MHNNKFVASSVYQKNVVDHNMEELELELCEELSEEEMMMVRGGRIKEVVVEVVKLPSPPRNEFFDWLWNNHMG